MVISVNKKKPAFVIFVCAVVIAAILLYKPYLKNFEYPLKYSEHVESSAERYDIDPYLVYSVMKAESKFDESAQSHKGAQGLMQITPETAKWAMEQMGLEGEIYRPEINIAVGSWYLAKLTADYGGNLTAVLAAYNAGATNVKKWQDSDGGLEPGDIAFEETRDYVYKTLEYYENYKKLYEKGKIK